MGLSQGPGATFPEIVKPQPSLGFPEPRLGEGSSAAEGGGHISRHYCSWQSA